MKSLKRLISSSVLKKLTPKLSGFVCWRTRKFIESSSRLTELIEYLDLDGSLLSQKLDKFRNSHP